MSGNPTNTGARRNCRLCKHPMKGHKDVKECPKKGSCKPWNNLTTNNDLTTNNELSNYSIELSMQMGVSAGPT